MPNFIPTGPLADFYSGNMAPPDRAPGGQLTQSQNFGQATTLGEIYRGIYAPGTFAPSGAEAQSEQNYGRNRNQGNIASSVSDSPLGAIYSGQNGANGSGAIGRSRGSLTAAANIPQIPGPNGYTDMGKDQSRLDTPYGFAFAGDQSAPGIAAIQAATQPPQLSLAGMFGRGHPSAPPNYPQWNPGSQTGLTPSSGDPWQELGGGSARVGPMPTNPGMVTGTPITVRGGGPPQVPVPASMLPAIHAALMAQQERKKPKSTYSQSPAGRDPAIHAALMAQQSSDQRGKGALDAAGTLKILGF